MSTDEREAVRPPGTTSWRWSGSPQVRSVRPFPVGAQPLRGMAHGAVYSPTDQRHRRGS